MKYATADLRWSNLVNSSLHVFGGGVFEVQWWMSAHYILNLRKLFNVPMCLKKH